MPAIFTTIAVKDSASVDRLIRVLDESGTGAGPYWHAAFPSYGDLANIEWAYAAAAGGIANTTTAVTIKAAAGVGLRNYITALQISSDALTNATELVVRDGAGGTVLWRMKIGTAGIVGGHSIKFPTPIKGTANTLLEVATLTASGAGGVFVNAQGFVAA